MWLLRGMLEKYQYLDKQERAFLTRLCEGTLERMTGAGCHHQPFFQSAGEENESR